MTENIDYMGFDEVPTTAPTIPIGEYTLRLVEPELLEKQDKTGWYIRYQTIVQVGPHSGFRIFRGMWSLASDKVWRFRRDLNSVSFDVPEGLTVLEAARYVVDNIAGFVFEGRITLGPRRVKNDEGQYEDDPDGAQENGISRWIGPAEL